VCGWRVWVQVVEREHGFVGLICMYVCIILIKWWNDDVYYCRNQYKAVRGGGGGYWKIYIYLVWGHHEPQERNTYKHRHTHMYI
jgi:hypothetical protein